MNNDPALEGERLALFEQALLRLGQTLERSLGAANAEIAVDLEAAAENEADARDRLLLMSAAGVLRQESSGRASSIARILADHATRCIEYARLAEDEARALDLLREDDVNQQMLVSWSVLDDPPPPPPVEVMVVIPVPEIDELFPLTPFKPDEPAAPAPPAPTVIV